MKLSTAFFAAILCIAPRLSAEEVVLDLAGQEIGIGKEIHLDSGFQRLPASAAYEFELDATVKGTGAFALFVPSGTSIEDFVDQVAPGTTIPTSGVAENPGGKLPFGVIKRNFSGPVPVPGVGNIELSFKLRAGVAADGRVYFSLTGLDIQIPGVPILGGVQFESGSTLTIRSLFEQFAGTYCGHVRADAFAIGSQGLAKVTVSPGGLISGQVLVGKKTYRVKSGLNQNRETPEIPLGKSGLRIRFSTDAAKPGVVTCEISSQAALLGTFDLSVGAYVAGPPTPRAGNYTALLNPPALGSGDTPSGKPAAPGCLRLKVSATGRVTFAGSLCDGAKVAGGSLVTEGDVFALFASLNSGFGGLFGDITLLSDSDPADLGGSLRWLKPAFPTEKVFPQGLDISLGAEGSRYFQPEPRQRALALTQGTVTFTDGNLPVQPPVSVRLTQGNKFIAPATLLMALNPVNGVLTGTYKPSGAKLVKFKGVILQKQNKGGAAFVGSPGSAIPVEAGAVTLVP